MEFQHLIVSQQNGIVTVRLNRPAERNALNNRLATELTEFARAFQTRPDVRAVILTGGPGFFSTGADVSAPAQAVNGKRPNLLALRAASMLGPDMCKAWEEIEAITIMSIEGYCVGAACARPGLLRPVGGTRQGPQRRDDSRERRFHQAEHHDGEACRAQAILHVRRNQRDGCNRTVQVSTG